MNSKNIIKRAKAVLDIEAQAVKDLKQNINKDFERAGIGVEIC